MKANKTVWIVSNLSHKCIYKLHTYHNECICIMEADLFVHPFMQPKVPEWIRLVRPPPLSPSAVPWQDTLSSCLGTPANKEKIHTRWIKKGNTHFKHHFPLIPTCSQPSHSESIPLTPGYWHYPLSQPFRNRLHFRGVARDWKERGLFTQGKKGKKENTQNLPALLQSIYPSLQIQVRQQSGSHPIGQHHFLL